jgi:hypothetical protein
VVPAHSRPVPVVRDEQSLVSLHAKLVDARSAVRADRSVSVRMPERSNAAEADLLECLEAFTAALTTRHLPIPRGLRDELRLRRGLSCPDRG